jgi:hypothetical protein
MPLSVAMIPAPVRYATSPREYLHQVPNFEISFRSERRGLWKEARRQLCFTGLV